MLIKYLISFFICLFFASLKADAQGIIFSKYRVILDSNSISSIYISNPTDTPCSYSVSIEDKKMLEDGSVIDINPDSTFNLSLKSYLRVFPRTIVIQPGSSQELQIQLKTPSSLPDGEYRSFLKLTPREQKAIVNDSSSQQGVMFGVKFQMVSMIPIIYRKNPTLEKVFIDSLKIDPVNNKDGKYYNLSMYINRVGSRTIYGRLYIRSLSKGKLIELNIPKNSAPIYTEVPRISMSTPIDIKDLDRDASGAILLNILFVDCEDKNVKHPNIWSESSYKVIIP